MEFSNRFLRLKEMATNTNKHASSAAPLTGRRGTTMEGRILHFYHNDHLATEHSDKGIRHILWAQDVAMAQLGQAVTTQILQVDQANSVLGMAPNTMVYSPYGHFAAVNSTSLLAFNGQRFDLNMRGYALGNGYRIYSPLLGRFCSPDTLSPFDRGGLNCYSYAEGDPINRVDPSGHISFKPFKNFFKGRKIKKLNRINQYNEGVIAYNEARNNRKLYNPYKTDGSIDFNQLYRNKKVLETPLPELPSLSDKDFAYAEKYNILSPIDYKPLEFREISNKLIQRYPFRMMELEGFAKGSPSPKVKLVRTSAPPQQPQQPQRSFFGIHPPRDRFGYNPDI
ncbi:RHS repeat-associated core domain-containing protein [Pseudomonas fluorescens]|uniref:RHS repeat-associated core domain-containing protein n=1 Tax=Pseudomonas fluorescens TaxID=294 RepID=UPI0020C2CE44|nr:RHS repeat-associated core domain-containing protein [Pseudomonas fluorescens]UTL90772.1 RHS repeat-associated core domain-containing protein [Pseudomonas fluorescens]